MQIDLNEWLCGGGGILGLIDQFFAWIKSLLEDLLPFDFTCFD